MKIMQYLYTFLVFLMSNSMLCAQSALEKNMFAHGKINVVYVVLSMVLTGLIGYAIYVYKNIKKYQKLNEE